MTSVPARRIAAWPSGTTWSPSGTSPGVKAGPRSMKNSTGLSSRMAAFSRPLKSAGVRGHHHLEARGVDEPGLEVVVVLRADAPAARRSSPSRPSGTRTGRPRGSAACRRC